MKRLWLAFVCFFRALLGRPLPASIGVEGASLEPLVPEPAPPRGPGPTEGAVGLLALLQREGRLVDFLLEAIDGFSDEQVGAAVRDVHRGCRKALREHFDLAPVRPEPEGAAVEIACGFDPAAIRLTGSVSGEPPFEGRIRHPGWRVERVDVAPVEGGIVAPAEVEC